MSSRSPVAVKTKIAREYSVRAGKDCALRESQEDFYVGRIAYPQDSSDIKWQYRHYAEVRKPTYPAKKKSVKELFWEDQIRKRGLI